ncbi:tetratricopeptide repeat protein [Streptosporangium sp. NBC_01755]|uniref:tetratricopeptide repeat protein n=1 Tax=Streptosporangium sp. NBC_01755 TaxID=2975949 RepID=UPI003FA35FF2
MIPGRRAPPLISGSSVQNRLGGSRLKESGSYEESRASYRLALATFGTFEDRLNESRALIGVGEAYQGMGQRGEARAYFGRAAALLENLGDSDAADLWERIGPLNDSGL